MADEEQPFQRVTRSRKRRSGGQHVNPGQRADGTVEDIQKTLDSLTSSSEIADLVAWCTNRIDRHLNGNPVSRIILLGNGHFDANWEPGAHQLAFVLQLQSKYATELLFQEPCCSFPETQWLGEQDNIIVRKELNLLIPPTKEHEIVIFIHGIHSFLNDLMWYRWEKLDKTIFICNNYSEIDLIGGRQSINDEHEALNVFRSTAFCSELPIYPPKPNFFSDSSIMFVHGELPEISRERPNYTETAE